MNAKLIAEKFEKMGARARVEQISPTLRVRNGGSFAVDVEDRKGKESFVLRVRSDDALSVEVLDVQPADMHLLLMVREGQVKSKFLCGHDERHWFVAAVPEDAGASTVASAKEALKPDQVRSRQRGLKRKETNRRSNSAFIRQGEWFFVPAPDIESKVTPAMILRDEPLFRSVNGRVGKHHVMEEAVRFGGDVVYVSGNRVLGEKAYRVLGEAERRKFTRRIRNPELYCRGTVRHADHKTIRLQGWHRVYMNTETSARAASRVEFLD